MIPKEQKLREEDTLNKMTYSQILMLQRNTWLCNTWLTTQEATAGGLLQLKDSLGDTVSSSQTGLSQSNNLSVMVYACNPSTWEAEAERLFETLP